MTYLLAALAVYKIVQFLDAMLPKEAMPWVKVSVGIILGYAISAVLHTGDMWTSGLVVATLAGAVHGILRLITLLGDVAARKSSR